MMMMMMMIMNFVLFLNEQFQPLKLEVGLNNINNSVLTSKKTQIASIPRTNWIMVFREIMLFILKLAHIGTTML
jgi:hypothetical protein